MSNLFRALHFRLDTALERQLLAQKFLELKRAKQFIRLQTAPRERYLDVSLP